MSITNGQFEDNVENLMTAHESVYQKLKASVIATDAAFQAAMLGERGVLSLQELKGHRALASATLDPAILAAMLAPQWEEIAETLGIPNGTPVEEIIDLYIQDMIDNSRTVLNRNITRGSPSASGSNTGDGVILRLTIDEHANAIEAGHIEAKEFRITEDQVSGSATRNSELGRIKGAQEPLDNFERNQMLRSGARGLLDLNVLDEEGGELLNASFTQNNTAGSVTTFFSGWTLDATTNFAVDTTNYFRKNPGVTNAASCKLSGVGTLTQDLLNVVTIDQKTPYMLTFVYNRQVGSAPGGTTFDLKLGNTTLNTVLGGAETGWNRVSLVLDETLWPRSWKTDEPKVIIDVTTLATGFLLIDEVLLTPMIPIDGTYYTFIGGATPFEATTVQSSNGIGDLFTWTDFLVGSDSIIQRLIALVYNKHLPHAASGAETWPDKALPA